MPRYHATVTSGQRYHTSRHRASYRIFTPRNVLLLRAVLGCFSVHCESFGHVSALALFRLVIRKTCLLVQYRRIWLFSGLAKFEVARHIVRNSQSMQRQTPCAGRDIIRNLVQCVSIDQRCYSRGTASFMSGFDAVHSQARGSLTTKAHNGLSGTRTYVAQLDSLLEEHLNIYATQLCHQPEKSHQWTLLRNC
jgi:hypothetical protein